MISELRIYWFWQYLNALAGMVFRGLDTLGRFWLKYCARTTSLVGNNGFTGWWYNLEIAVLYAHVLGVNLGRSEMREYPLPLVGHVHRPLLLQGFSSSDIWPDGSYILLLTVDTASLRPAINSCKIVFGSGHRYRNAPSSCLVDSSEW